MKTAKKAVTTFILGMMAVQQVAWANPSDVSTPVVIPVVPGQAGGKGSSTVVTGAGNTNINQVSLETTEALKTLFSHAAITQKADKEYLESVINRLSEQAKDLAKLKAMFQKLALLSATGVQTVAIRELVPGSESAPVRPEDKIPTFQAYLDLVNQIKNREEMMKIEIASSTSISRETLPSFENVIKVGDTSASMSNYGNINMQPIVTKWDGVRNDLMNSIRATGFSGPLIHIRGSLRQPIMISSDALEPVLKGVMLLSREEIVDLEKQIRMDLTLELETMEFAQSYVEKTVNLVKDFVTEYGTTERFRPRDENDAKARAEAYDLLYDAFYRRSYLRKKYGVRLGAIQSTGYPKKILNLDQFAIGPVKQAVDSFRTQAALTDDEVSKAFAAARQFVQLYDEKVTPVFSFRSTIMENADKNGEYSSNDTGFLVRANSAWTFMSGQRPTSEVLLAIMRLALADAREEMMLLKDDRVQLAAYHDARYRSTEEMKTKTALKICQQDWTLSEDAHAKNCVPRGVKQKAQRRYAVGARPAVGDLFSELLAQLGDVEQYKRAQAAAKQQMVTMAKQAAAGVTGSAGSSSAEDDLF